MVSFFAGNDDDAVGPLQKVCERAERDHIERCFRPEYSGNERNADKACIAEGDSEVFDPVTGAAGQIRDRDGRRESNDRDQSGKTHRAQLFRAEFRHIAAQNDARDDRIQQHVGKITAALFGDHAAAREEQTEQHERKHDDGLLKKNLSDHKYKNPVSMIKWEENAWKFTSFGSLQRSQRPKI